MRCRVALKYISMWNLLQQLSFNWQVSIQVQKHYSYDSLLCFAKGKDPHTFMLMLMTHVVTNDRFMSSIYGDKWQAEFTVLGINLAFHVMNTPIDFEYKARGNKFHALLLNKFDWCKISLDTSQIRVCPFLYIGSYKITTYVEIQKMIWCILVRMQIYYPRQILMRTQVVSIIYIQ